MRAILAIQVYLIHVKKDLALGLEDGLRFWSEHIEAYLGLGGVAPKVTGLGEQSELDRSLRAFQTLERSQGARTMAAERRKEHRRESDRILLKMLEILRVVEKLSRGEEVDFTEAYADLVGLKDQLGRRKEDRDLGEALCATVGAIACNVAQKRSPGLETGRRRVRLTRLGGGKGETHKVIEGWENGQPQLGKSYLIFQEGGRVVRTSPLTRISGAFLQTRNSLYQLEVIGDWDTAKIRLPPRKQDQN